MATANYALSTKVHGHVAMQQTLTALLTFVDTRIAAIEARLDAIEGGLDDSNSQFIDI